MSINENTQIMARFHTTANNRGLNIYNPYFQEAGVNAVYLLFYNADPRLLFDGLKKLNLAGAIPAGFEKDPQLVELMDELDPVAERTNRVGVVQHRDGKLTGYYQAPHGLTESIRQVSEIEEKDIVFLGAGNVVRGMLVHFEEENINPGKVSLYNRTVSKAKDLASEFSVVSTVGSLDEMELNATGHVFINATDIGAPWRQGKDYQFNNELIERFDVIADVTFVPLKPQLVEVAESLGKMVAPGWQMFVYQGKMCLEKILGIEVKVDVLAEKCKVDFEKNWS